MCAFHVYAIVVVCSFSFKEQIATVFRSLFELSKQSKADSCDVGVELTPYCILSVSIKGGAEVVNAVLIRIFGKREFFQYVVWC